VFVDAAAPEGGDGSLTSPLSSIVAALALAKDADATDIYICPGNYDESVLITDNEAGIDLHGGFRCEGFTYDATAIPVIEPSNGDYALHIDALTSAILLEHLAFSSVNADEAGESSIAVFISESSDVTFEQCQFSARNGASGATGVTEDFIEGPTAGVNWPAASLLNGNHGSSTLGGAATPEFNCPGTTDTTWGGKGGDITAGALDGEDGGPVGRGGAGDEAGPCIFGDHDGTPGDPGLDGDPGAAAGVLTASGFTPNPGEDGTVGEVGGGGGGGGGSDNDPVIRHGGGGGGGAGGCGGNYGPGGQGGGASIALLVFDSVVILQDSSLISGNAGDGGWGDLGQVGQEGGEYGFENPDGCPGGQGANGGAGGGGGGGAGGISVGVLWTGAVPQLDQTTTDAITVGAEGLPGKSVGADSDGASGFAAAVHQL
jgi:hypothetical protein